ncbi:MAG TPA: DUF1707 domain-containing protein [Urbifossiella sp.]|jgi:hypothetical protein|nr:DUF1707 domain-containing protein [Urbifossiella sp.]
MRVSDAEREAAATELREHFASGRLNQDELDERLTAVFAAKTRGDLNALFTDLPSSQRDWADPSTPAAPRSGGFGPGPFGGGPFGAGPFGGGRFGAGGADWGAWTPAGTADADADADADWQARGGGWRASRGRGFGRFATTAVLIWALFLLGILGVFGIGTGRPLGIVLIVAAFALLRRLVFIFTRRGRGRGRGGRGGPRRRR